MDGWILPPAAGMCCSTAAEAVGSALCNFSPTTAWASSQHGDRVAKVNVLRKRKERLLVA
jgi:hypothetical protein